MKYTESLTSQVAPEWITVCLDYEKLKVILYSSTATAKDFFDACAKELSKVNAFFVEKVAISQRTLQRLEDVHNAKANGRSKIVSSNDWFWGAVTGLLWGSSPINRSRDSTTLTLGQLKAAYKEFQYELVLLKQFQIVNAEGFRKILKKRDKVCSCSQGAAWKADVVDQTELGKNTGIDAMLSKLEKDYINLFGGDRNSATRNLRLPSASDKEDATFDAWWWIGFGFGFFLVFTAYAVATIFQKSSGFWSPPWLIVRIYRGFFIMLFSVFLYGVAVGVWGRIANQPCLGLLFQILELNPRKYLTREQIWSTVAGFAGLWALSFLSYLHLPLPGVFNFNRLHSPLILCGICFVWACSPIDFGRRSTRAWLWKYGIRYLLSPCHKIHFVDYWFGEQMTSLVPVFVDVVYVVCLYAKEIQRESMEFKERGKTDYKAWGIDTNTGADRCSSGPFWPRPVAAALPFLLMVILCFRLYCGDRRRKHLLNALKYATAFPVIIFNALMAMDKENGHIVWYRPFVYLWVISCAINFVFTSIWDVRFDWALRTTSQKHPQAHLSDNLAHEKLRWSKTAVVANVIMRLNWIIVISPSVSFAFIEASDAVRCGTAVIECVRRCIWNIFVLEQEHLENVRLRRAVREHVIGSITNINDERLLRSEDSDHLKAA